MVSDPVRIVGMNLPVGEYTPTQILSEQTSRGVELLQGEEIELFASGARGAGVNILGVWQPIYGERCVYTWLLNVTATLTDLTDTFDCYIDTLIGQTPINIAHFTRILGNGGAAKRFVVTVPTNMVTTDLATVDCGTGIARGVVGSHFRGRYTIVDPGAGAALFTFSLIGYAL